MTTKLKSYKIRSDFHRFNIGVITPRNFQRLYNLKPYQSKHFLETQVHEDFLVRLKNGLYGIKGELPAEETIANALYTPSYISFEYALAYYGILPEAPYSITSATTAPTREFTVDGKVFNYFTIKKEAFTGYRFIKLRDKSFLIAEPEKALVDYLYFVSLGKKLENDRLYVENLDQDKLHRYADLFKRKSLNNLLYVRKNSTPITR